MDSFFFRNTIAITDPRIFIAPTEIAVKLAALLSTMIPLKMFTAYATTAWGPLRGFSFTRFDYNRA